MPPFQESGRFDKAKDREKAMKTTTLRLLLEAAAGLCMIAGGCFCLPQPFEPGAIFIRESHPKTHADFDWRFPTDFQVGSKFELLQDMYLFDGIVDSTWELRRSAWNQSRPVLRVVRKGETIEISALKLSPYQRNLFVYLKLESGEDWVVYNLFDWPNKGHYDRNLFRKVSEGEWQTPGQNELAE